MKGDELRPRGATPPPEELKVFLRERDTKKVARGVFAEIETLRSQPVPAPFEFPDPAALKAWREHGTPIPDLLLGSFTKWLEVARARSEAIGENMRRLRNTTWAQMQLRGTDYEQHFADFHRREWGITRVCSDSAEREQQVQAVARNGQRRDVRHG